MTGGPPFQNFQTYSTIITYSIDKKKRPNQSINEFESHIQSYISVSSQQKEFAMITNHNIHILTTLWTGAPNLDIYWGCTYSIEFPKIGSIQPIL